MEHWTDEWEQLSPKPCQEAWEWAKTQPDWQTAWRDCPRGDWMVYRLGRGLEQGSPAHRKLVGVVVECARLSLPYAGSHRDEMSSIYEALDRWAAGEAIDLEALVTAIYAAAAAYYSAVHSAAAAADDAAGAAYAAASAAAVYAAAAADAAGAAYAAASAAAVYAAAYAADDAADVVANAAKAARRAALAQCADIVRRHYPAPPTPQKVSQSN